MELIGAAVFSVSGALSAGRKGMDFLGVIVLAALTAIGGGTLRDLLLNRHPIFWITDPTVLYIIIGAALFTLCYVRVKPPPNNSLLWADALGLALFTLSGTQIAEAIGLSPIIVVLMGTITGVAGGVMRDILSAEIPLILRGEIYATAAIIGSSLYLILKALSIRGHLAFALGMFAVFILRSIAILYSLRMPRFTLPNAQV
jgi:uncharacterized membrane protein YeiH